MWVSYRGWVRGQQQKREMFADDAMRRGLSAHQCQIVQAIAARSGIRRVRDVFTQDDAFDRGAAQLLAECARTRTPQENEYLRAEIAELRAELGFQTAWPHDEEEESGFQTAALHGEEIEQNVPSNSSTPTDSVLIVFGLAEAMRDVSTEGYRRDPKRTVAMVGQVRRWQRAGRGVCIAVELTDLSDAEIDDLMDATSKGPSRANDRSQGSVPPAPGQGPEVDETARRMAPAT
jgi:hypothetical protein